MTDTAIDSPGLRERKRIATRRAIEIAAITLVQKRGLDAVTIDDIAQAADISPRTFFNYFASKEEAIVGRGLELPSPEAQDAFVADPAPVLTAMVTLLTPIITSALQDQEVLRLRRRLVKSDQELAVRRWASVHRFEAQLVELVERRLAAQDPALAADPTALRSRARITTFVAVAGMRHAWIGWIDENGEPPSLQDRLAESYAQLPDVVAASV
jgi:AcrR family transcriptional regulator